MKLIIGDGLLGKELIKQTGWQYISRKKDRIDINDILSISKLIPNNCTHLINCAANTDTYSNNREAMMQANYTAVKHLVELCKDKNIKYVHYSTDYVYAGSVENASEIDEAIADKTWYAQSKLLADQTPPGSAQANTESDWPPKKSASPSTYHHSKSGLIFGF